MHSFFRLFLSWLLLLPFAVLAQNFTGYNISSYSGVVGIDIQPASIADSRYKIDVLMGAQGFEAQNNFVAIDRRQVDSALRHALNNNKYPAPAFIGTHPNYDGSRKKFYEGISDRHGIMVSISPKISVGATF